MLGADSSARGSSVAGRFSLRGVRLYSFIALLLLR